MKKIMSIMLSMILCFSVLCVMPNRAEAKDKEVYVSLNEELLNFSVQPQIKIIVF